MKRILFILGLLMCALFLAPEDHAVMSENNLRYAQENAFMNEDSQTKDFQHKIEILSNELKGSNCLTPRRAFQTISHSFDIRFLKHIEKEHALMRLKNVNQLNKIYQTYSYINSSHISTLEHRMGKYVYSLRKLII